MNVEEKVTSLEKETALFKSELEHLKDDVAIIKKDVSNVKDSNTEFIIELNKFSTALDSNTKSINKLTTYFDEMNSKPNQAIDKIKWTIITALISSGLVAGIIYLIKKLIQL